METVRRVDLEIGDIIRLPGIEGYNDATVYQVKDGQVYVVRPYVHTADFICTSGVITYLGQEEFSMPADSTAVQLLSSRHPEETRNKVRAIISDIRYCLEKGQTALALEKLRQL